MGTMNIRYSGYLIKCMFLNNIRRPIDNLFIFKCTYFSGYKNMFSHDK